MALSLQRRPVDDTDSVRIWIFHSFQFLEPQSQKYLYMRKVFVILMTSFPHLLPQMALERAPGCQIRSK